MMEEVGLSPFQNQHSPAVGVSPLDPNVDYYGCGSGLVPYTQSDSSGEDSEGQCDILFQLDDGDNGAFEDEDDEEQHDTQEEDPLPTVIRLLPRVDLRPGQRHAAPKAKNIMF